MEKSLLKSKTFWLSIVMAISPLFPPIKIFIEGNPQVIATIWAVLTIALRLISKDKVSLLP